MEALGHSRRVTCEICYPAERFQATGMFKFFQEEGIAAYDGTAGAAQREKRHSRGAASWPEALRSPRRTSAPRMAAPSAVAPSGSWNLVFGLNTPSKAARCIFVGRSRWPEETGGPVLRI